MLFGIAPIMKDCFWKRCLQKITCDVYEKKQKTETKHETNTEIEETFD